MDFTAVRNINMLLFRKVSEKIHTKVNKKKFN